MNYPLPPPFFSEEVPIKKFLAIPDLQLEIERKTQDEVSTRSKLVVLGSLANRQGLTQATRARIERAHEQEKRVIVYDIDDFSVRVPFDKNFFKDWRETKNSLFNPFWGDFPENMPNASPASALISEMNAQPPREPSMELHPSMLAELPPLGISRIAPAFLREVNKKEHRRAWLRSKFRKQSLVGEYDSIVIDLYNPEPRVSGEVSLFAWWEHRFMSENFITVEMTGDLSDSENDQVKKHYDQQTILHNICRNGFQWNAVDLTVFDHQQDSSWFDNFEDDWGSFFGGDDTYRPSLRVSTSRSSGSSAISWSADEQLSLGNIDMSWRPAGTTVQFSEELFHFNPFYKNRVQVEIPPRTHIRLKFYTR